LLCNVAKAARLSPNPEQVLLADDVRVHDDGSIEGKTPDARRLIRVIGLDEPEYKDFRNLWLGIVALAKQHDPALYRTLMCYPRDLPNLASLRPPKGNSRPDGVQQSCCAARQNSLLPETY
jgi:hypothetical protein